MKAKAECGEGYNRVNHVVVVCLGVEEGYRSREAELADYIEGDFFYNGWCCAVTSFNGILFGGNSLDGDGLIL